MLAFQYRENDVQITIYKTQYYMCKFDIVDSEKY